MYLLILIVPNHNHFYDFLPSSIKPKYAALSRIVTLEPSTHQTEKKTANNKVLFQLSKSLLDKYKEKIIAYQQRIPKQC